MTESIMFKDCPRCSRELTISETGWVWGYCEKCSLSISGFAPQRRRGFISFNIGNFRLCYFIRTGKCEIYNTEEGKKIRLAVFDNFPYDITPERLDKLLLLVV